MAAVSICLPNLNTRPFLEERLESILRQTYEDWELLVSDNYSNDGAWDVFSHYAEKEPRMRIWQTPRQGMYDNINTCVRRANGRYIYLATSDDTMRSDCLEKMVRALDAHAHCGICECNLTIIDESGKDIGGWHEFFAPRFFGDLLAYPHQRLAPYDGILHTVVGTVYTSLTQLLIRRRVFEEVGLFGTAWGSWGDFEWGMRASLKFDVFHLPEYLATWRVHQSQATQKTDTVANRKSLKSMCRSAIDSIEYMDGALFRALSRDWERLTLFYNIDEIVFATRDLMATPSYDAAKVFGECVLLNPVATAKLLHMAARGQRISQERLSWIRRYLSQFPTAKVVVEDNAGERRR